MNKINSWSKVIIGIFCGILLTNTIAFVIGVIIGIGFKGWFYSLILLTCMLLVYGGRVIIKSKKKTLGYIAVITSIINIIYWSLAYHDALKYGF